MPQRLSEVVRRHAQGRAAAGAHDAGMGTPAEMLLRGQHGPEMPEDRRVISASKTPSASPGTPDESDAEPPAPTMPPPLPLAADPEQMAGLKTKLAEAQRSLHQSESELEVLSAAQARARDQRIARRAEVDQAQASLRDCREHARTRLVERFVNGTPDGGMTVTEAAAELDRCRRQLAAAEELDDALRAEKAGLVEQIARERQAVRRAAGALISRSPSFLAEVRAKVYDAYADLRLFRTLVSDLDRVVFLDAGLTQLIDNMQPCDSGRRPDYHLDEIYVGGWLDAARRLLDAADTPLPDPGGTGSTTPISELSPVRGARIPASRKPGAGRRANSSCRPRRSAKRASAKTAMSSVRRTALARERDPLTGKFKRKAADQSPLPE